MDDSYRTLENQAEGVYREKGSRFLAFGFPVKHENEIRDILTGIRKKYHDARHHCFAYRLGYRKETYRVYDDGEPSGTAGRPIYGQLVSHGLTNTLVVVVRYFGGTLLGKGGLMNAYRSAAMDMLSRSTIITRFVQVKLKMCFPYDVLNTVMKILKDEALIPGSPVYEASCSMYVMVREKSMNRLIDRLRTIPGLRYDSLQIED